MDISKSTAWRPGAAVCRCCLTEGCYKDISTEYFWMGQKEVYSEMLLHTFDVTISYAQSGGPNSQSRLICDGCISRLREASEFKKQVQQCEKTFMEHLDGGASSNIVLLGADSDPVKIGEEAVKIEDVKVERLHSDDDVDGFADQGGFDDNDGFDSDLDDEPLTKLATKKPKKEKEVELDIPEPPKTTKRKSVIKLKGTASKKAKTKKAETGESSKTKVAKEKKKGWALKEKNMPTQQPRYDDERANASIIVQHSSVCAFRVQRGTYICLFCPSSFPELNQLKEHYVKHENLETLHLPRNNGRIKIEISNITCKLCDERFTSVESLANHLLDQHKRLINKATGLGVEPFLLKGDTFFCIHCSDKFQSFNQMNNHINTHYADNICNHCGKFFTSIFRLKRHLLTHESSKGKEHFCGKCGLSFETWNQKNKHYVTAHKSNVPYKCPYCDQHFKYYLQRTKHLNEQHGKKVEFPCHLCPAVFMLHSNRTIHINNFHLKLKEFSCELCTDSFVSSSKLKSHMVKHVGERKFQCDICKKAYARRKTLTEHMRIHNNDRRFACEFCNSAFVQKCSLKGHMKTHHPEAECSQKLILPKQK